MTDNPFSYTIPIAAGAGAGIHAVDVSFKINNIDYITRQHMISIPTAQLDFSAPAAFYNAGETIELILINPGGKNGQFDIQASLNDSFYKIIHQTQETRSLSSGSSDSFQFTKK